MMGGIAAACNNNAIAPGKGNGIANRMRQFACYFPLGGGLFQHINIIVPLFDAAIPGSAAMGEVAATGYKQGAIADTGDRTGKAYLIGNSGELRPLEVRCRRWIAKA